jgi:hypothetical protein
MFKRVIVFAAALAIPAATPAQAPPPSPVAFSGTLISFAEDSVALKDKEGKTVVVQMTSGWTVSIARVADAGTIKPGAFVATANAFIDANSGKSTEVRVLEAGYRPEEGSHGMEGSTNYMTHGTVAGVDKRAAGVELNVTWPGGSRRIIVPSDVTVTFFDLQERSTLKPGVVVTGVTRKGPDGVPRAGRLVLSN